MTTKIFLVGMPGAGKTTFGKVLARELRWQFTDLDHEIERIEGKTVTEIFRKDGEPFFRAAEGRALKSLAATTQELVIATGGGAPCFHKNMKFMNDSGATIFLNPSLDELEKRVKKENQRPLFHHTSVREKLEELYTRRIKHYRQAKITIDQNSPDVQRILQELGLKSH